jgi:CRISPR type III-B/RAMP module RAMP protein Cmr6
MRIASNGATLLLQQAAGLKKKSRGNNVTSDNAARLADEASRCHDLANTKVGSGLEKHRAAHTSRFLALLRDNYTEGRRLHITAARLEGRLALNLADGLIQNAGMSLDRIFGLPLIPGSAVKGVARHAALDELKREEDAAPCLALFARVFGSADNDYTNGELKHYANLRRDTGLPENIKGAVTFLQATPLNDAQIVVDITNVHYPDFYRTGHVEDQSKETPKPNYFPAIERGAEFAFPIILNGLDPDPALLAAAARWLTAALTVRGLGAKTAAGYGWFSPCPGNYVADLLAQSEHEKQACLERERKAREDAQRLAAEKAEAEKAAKIAAAKKQQKADFDKLTPAEQLAAIATDNGQFRNFMEKRFSSLTPDEKADIVRWFASDKGNARWVEIREAASKGKKPWSQIVPQIHVAKKAAGLKLP